MHIPRSFPEPWAIALRAALRLRGKRAQAASDVAMSVYDNLGDIEDYNVKCASFAARMAVAK